MSSKQELLEAVSGWIERKAPEPPEDLSGEDDLSQLQRANWKRGYIQATMDCMAAMENAEDKFIDVVVTKRKENP